jgi:hypothetical protein
MVAQLQPLWAAVVGDPSPNQPDLHIKTGTDDDYSGDDIYNDTPAHTKTQTTSLAPGVYQLIVENDGTATDTITVTGTAGAGNWTVKYLNEATEADITAAVTGAGWSTGALAPGSHQYILIEVSAAIATPTGEVFTTSFTATSVGDPGKDDMAMGITTCGIPPRVERVSISTGGVQGNELSFYPSISSNGRFVVFSSRATTLVANDTYTGEDVFWRDRLKGTTTCVSADAQGQTRGGTTPVISPNGRYVAFVSSAALVPDDTNNVADVYLRDMTTGLFTRVSVPDGTSGQTTVASASPTISEDGRFIAFSSAATNLVAGDTNNQADIFIRDRVNGTTIRIAGTGVQPNGASANPAINRSGAYVAFTSLASNFVERDTNNQRDVFVYSRLDGSIKIMSWGLNDTVANGESLFPTITPGGAYVGFVSSASNLVPGDTNQHQDVFVRTRTRMTIERVNVAADGTQGNDDACYNDPGARAMAMSLGRRFVIYNSRATNLVAGDTNYSPDLFINDRPRKSVSRVLTNTGAQVNEKTGFGGMDITADGRWIAFESHADNLVTGDTNDRYDIFVFGPPYNQPDLQVKAEGVATYLGDDIYGDADGQRVAQTIGYGAAARYDVLLQNDAVAAANLALTGTPSGAGWTVRYLDPQNGNADVSTQVTGGGWRIDNLGGGATYALRVEVQPGPNVPANAQWPIILRTFIVGDPEQFDVAELRTTRDSAAAVPRPDLQIRSLGQLLYAGDEVYNLTGIDQTAAQVMAVDQTVTYQLLLENDGNAEGAFRVSIPSVDAGWAVRVFNAYAGGTEITPQVLDGSWETPVLGFNEAQELRLEVRVTQTLAPQSVSTIPLLATAPGADGERDLVRSITTLVQAQPRPDLLIRSADQAVYQGDDLYNELAAQSVVVMTTNTLPAVYFCRAENDGNVADTLTVTVPPALPGWTLRIFDAPQGGTDITQAVTRVGGWQLLNLQPGMGRDFRLEVTPGSTTVRGGECALLVQVASARERTRVDEGLATATTDGLPLIRSSVSSAQASGDGESLSPATSASGRYVLFTSAAATLVGGDTNRVSDIFMRDRQTGTTTRVSLSSTGVQANSWSDSPAISGDGRYVVFRSAASNLVAGDTNGRADIFLYDCVTHSTIRVSGPTGGQSNADADGATISADGSVIAFSSVATNLVSGDTNGVADVFIYGRAQGTLTRMSVPSMDLANRTTQGNGASDLPTLSGDGRYVVFRSLATNLVAMDTNRTFDVFLADRQTGIVERVSVSSTGGQGQSASGTECASSISADGRYVAFRSLAAFSSADTNLVADIYLRDRQARTTTLVSRALDGTPANAESGTRGLALSADGLTVAFTSAASNLVPGDTNGVRDVFVVTWQTGLRLRVNRLLSGQQTSQDSGGGIRGVALSSDARFVAFDSMEALEPADTNGLRDVYQRDLVGFHTVGEFLTDLLVQAEGESSFSGEGLYTAAQQQRTQAVTAGTPATYIVRVKNTGRYSSVCRVNGPAGSSGWSIRYFQGTTEVTTDIVGSGWGTPELMPGASTDLRVQVTPPVAGAIGGVRSVEVTATCQQLLAATDTVRLLTSAASLSRVMLAISTASSVVAGTSVTLTATPTGGHVVEYRFRQGMRSGSGWIWTDLNSFTPASTITWTPTEAGSFTLVALARESGTTTIVSATRALTVLPPPPTAVSLTVDPARGARVGTALTLQAVATGGYNVQYQFRMGYKSGTTWTWETIRPYASTGQCVWTPPAARVYTLLVYARSMNSTRPYDVYTPVSVTVSP